MDKFMEEINDCLGKKGYTLDDLMSDKILKDAEKTYYEKQDKELINTFYKVLTKGNIHHLLTFINLHHKNIDIMCFGNQASIQIFSHNPDKEWAIESYNIKLNEDEQELVESYFILDIHDILHPTEEYEEFMKEMKGGC